MKDMEEAATESTAAPKRPGRAKKTVRKPAPSVERNGDGVFADLEAELAWFTAMVAARFRAYFEESGGESPSTPPSPPAFANPSSPWATFIDRQAPTVAERLALVLALVPHLRPQLLDVFFTKNSTFDRRFTEFGGVIAGDEFLPTGETLAFLLGGNSLAARVEAARILEPDHRFIRDEILRRAPGDSEQSAMKRPVRLAPELAEFLLTGKAGRPRLGAEFPAQPVSTELTWEDLILHPGTLGQLREIQSFITHGKTLMSDWGMAARLRPGHRALFHGPPGTGKTLSACLLGKASGRAVYRIDLSLVASKYIGETEKNLSRVFDGAQRHGWILFFDEADALFGKRSETKTAHDRYANQETAYLLQRVETFDGIAILASNLRDNLDEAFSRRFESVIYFPIPGRDERLRLWKQGFSAKAKLAADVDLQRLADEHELAGGSIMNVIRQVSLAAIADGERPISQEDLVKAVRRERAKEGRQS